MTEPRLLPENRPFFDSLLAGQLSIQECGRCRACQLGSDICRSCGATDLHWRASSGKGEIVALTTVRMPPSPDMPVPYVLALVELDDGPRLLGRLHGGPLDACAGRRAVISFSDRRGDFVLPSFTLLDDRSD